MKSGIAVRKANRPALAARACGPARRVLQTEGRPLDSATQSQMGGKFGHDFRDVRVHTDPSAAESASRMGAAAYTLGRHIVFGAGRYEAHSHKGRDLLAHELMHVVQHRSASRLDADAIEPADSLREHNAEALKHLAPSQATSAQIDDGSPAGLALTRDTQLDDYLRRFQQAASSIRAAPDDRARLERIIQHFSGVDLRDEDNLAPVSDAVAQLMPEETLFLFLDAVEHDVRLARIRADEARMQNTERLLRVGHGAGVGPGLFPMMGAMGQAAVNVAEGVSTSLAAFLAGVAEGFAAGGHPDFGRRLLLKLTGTAVLNVVAPAIFAAGAVVGIGEDVWKAIKGVWDLITNFRAMIQQFEQLFRLMLSPTAAAVGRVAGRHVGKGLRDQAEELTDENAFHFTFDVGRIVGPTIVYIVLAILGIGLVEIVGEMAQGLMQVLRRWPAAMRIIEGIGQFFRRVRPGPLAGATGEEIEGALANMESPRTTGGSRPRIDGRPVPTRRVPRLDAGDIPLRAGEDLAGALERIRRVIGRKLSEIPEIQAAWNRARAAVLSNRTLTAQNYEELYNLTRNRFWREVRADPAAAARFTQAGFVFPGRAESAAILGGVQAGVPAEESLVSLDHILEKGQGNNWQLALDADNLQFEFARPNSFREIVQMRHPALRTP